MFLYIGAVSISASSVASMYGLGTGSIAFNFLRCAGTESRLIDCVSVRHRSCSHAEDVGARCLVRTGTNVHQNQHFITSVLFCYHLAIYTLAVVSRLGLAWVGVVSQAQPLGKNQGSGLMPIHVLFFWNL